MSQIPWKCIPCQVQCNSDVDYQHHIKGIKHTKHAKLEQKAATALIKPTIPWKCAMCQVQCNSDIDYQHHIKGIKHAKLEQRTITALVKSINHLQLPSTRPNIPHQEEKKSARRAPRAAIPTTPTHTPNPNPPKKNKAPYPKHNKPHMDKDSYTERLKAIVKIVDFDPEDIKIRSRKLFWQGHAKFRCGIGGGCGHPWSSIKAGVDVDLLNLEVVKVYKQKCTKCDTEALPKFTDFDDMMRKLIEWITNPPDKQKDSDENKNTKPHHANECEVCGYGSNPRNH